MPVSSFTHLTPLAFLERAAEVFADKTAIAYGDRRTSYSEFGAEATQLAHALRGSGVQSGDRVAYMCPNIPEMLVPTSVCHWPAQSSCPSTPGCPRRRSATSATIREQRCSSRIPST